jgi:adenylate cyclase
MRRAAERNVLVGLAGDLALRPAPTLTAEDVAGRTGLSPNEVLETTLAVGFPPAAPGERLFTDDDVAIFGTFAAGARFFGTTPIRRFVRKVAASLASIADAAVSLYLATAQRPLREAKASDLVLAQQNLRAVRSLEGLYTVMDAMFRMHMAGAIRQERQARREESPDTQHLTVCFVDLVGFTRLARQMTTAELAELVERFEDSAYDVITAGGGRLVKLIGDEVMFIAVDASAACDIALTLVERFAGDRAVTPRGALASGELLARGGDYYGPIVNLASRLAELAVPGELLVTAAVAAEATSAGLRFEAAGKRMPKGFDEPVTLLAVGRA